MFGPPALESDHNPLNRQLQSPGTNHFPSVANSRYYKCRLPPKINPVGPGPDECVCAVGKDLDVSAYSCLMGPEAGGDWKIRFLQSVTGRGGSIRTIDFGVDSEGQNHSLLLGLLVASELS